MEPAPVYDHEKGTPVEDQKKGKTKWEVATGHPFLGTIYPLRALVYYYHRSSDGMAAPTTRPGIFAGWKLAPGRRYKDTVQILDYECMSLGRPLLNDLWKRAYRAKRQLTHCPMPNQVRQN